MKAIDILDKYFGYKEFKTGQESAISAILDNRDVLGIMPTGAGKSVCYQVPAMLFHGVTLVISPLIALMHDQVISLKEAGIAAAYINSTLSPMQIETVLYNAKCGKYKIIYVAPERLNSNMFLEFSKTVDIAMVTVDEAHCISQWGQDFRPSYIEIPEFINSLKTRPVVSAFTATATEKVKNDIARILELKNPEILVTGFDRKNLYFEVQHPKNKKDALLKIVKEYKAESGIVYCTSRKGVEEVCQTLIDGGYSATRYHAGLGMAERKTNQEDFINDRKKIMVATNAFGMGIDKSNVNFVVHYNLPKDLESYYQEAGRAGRDGSDAKCILLYSPQDVLTIKWMIENTDQYKGEDAEEAIQELKDREYKRLSIMTFYATVNCCLRSYILNYFGDESIKDCGNCSNCKETGDTENVTVDSKQILLCVRAIKESFGASMVIDILRGSNREMIRSRGFKDLDCYNSTKRSANQLKLIVAHLVYNGYLIQLNGQYPLLQLGDKAIEVFEGNDEILIKLPEDSKRDRERKPSKSYSGKPASGLFEKLRDIRADLATLGRVPSYIIFPDKTLVNMCEKMPKTHEEMLQVSGVGEVKMKRYGEEFLNAIIDYSNEHPEIKSTSTSSDSEFIVELIDITVKPGAKVPKEILDLVETTDELTIVTNIAKRVQQVFEVYDINEKITAVKIGRWLVEKGYLKTELNNLGKNIKVATDYGTEKGVAQEERVRGNDSYIVNLFPLNLQKIIIENVNEILGL